MTRHIDGFVHPIPKDKLDAYKSLVAKVAKIWKEHGALDYWECEADGFEIEGLIPFSEVIKATNNEVVLFGWVVFESNESRQAAHAAVPADPRMKELMDGIDTGFDASRMVYGGFQPFVPAA